MAPALQLPRSVLLALWLAAPADARRATLAVQGEDEPHVVHRGEDDVVPLVQWLTDSPPAVEVGVALPVPGDPVAVPPPASGPAAQSGECVLVARGDGATAVAVPHVQRFGSEYEPGHLVRWDVVEVADWRPAAHAQVGSLEEAERALRDGLRTATEALVELDVASWRADAADEIATVRDGALTPSRLPTGLEGQRLRVLTSAARLRAIVRLAARDDGGAVNLWQADQRSTALREVDRVARRAMAAAATRLTR
ncbi:hypothetical protein [Cellulomonas shaoxiangyii]|uniref:Secreted protein n=1 Tax=Cellulomonas shaoxiangyii TaxID=2566013 RepID=A0A4P7SHU9_9CELL|nr:hypothetical protein [Cellulomonas shaoxiangyii]QCB93809.1 hypothetical protein E5225_09790 [Cellulomonas shaoxiangyii]TGY84904.1 hypothetical protein E5226_08985 [Cellulomonas shaoxiangyii]